MKIKLIFPPAFNADKHLMCSPPLGMATLTSYIRKNGYEVEQYDFSNYKIKWNSSKTKFNINDSQFFSELNPKTKLQIIKILKKINCKKSDLIGFSILSKYQFPIALILAKKIKEKGCKIVFGGPLATLYSDLFFRKYGFIDFAITGGGELPLLKLTKFLEGKVKIENVPSLTYRINGNINRNRERNIDIDESFAPDFNGLDINDYRYTINGKKDIIIPYYIMKGCKRKCAFCTYWVCESFSIKSIKKVISDIKDLKDNYRSRYFFFFDSAINLDYDYLSNLCDEIIKNGLNIFWGVCARPDNLDKDILEKMKKAGCIFLIYGIESGSDRILKYMNKGFTTEQASKVIKNAYRAKIMNFVNIISGPPHEKHSDLKKTLEFIKKHGKYIHMVKLQKFSLEHGSVLTKNPSRYKIYNLKSVENLFCKLNFDIITRNTDYIFDEIDGLKWKDKIKQQKNSLKLLSCAMHNYVGDKIGIFGEINFLNFLKRLLYFFTRHLTLSKYVVSHPLYVRYNYYFRKYKK